MDILVSPNVSPSTLLPRYAPKNSLIDAHFFLPGM